MESPTYALTSPSSQSEGAVCLWNPSYAATNGSIARVGSSPISASRSRSLSKWWNSADAIFASSALSPSVGASLASSASRSNAASSP
jgi:hypothetical protein